MEKMLLSSAEQWSRLGYACDVLATAPDIGPLAQPLREAGYGVHHIPFRGSFRYLPHRRFFADYFALCRSGYDIVHIHTEAAVPLFALVAKLAGVPQLVLTPHNTFYFSGLLRMRKVFERWLLRMLGGRYGMISDGVQQCEWQTFRNPGVRIFNWFDAARFRVPTAEERDSARSSVACPSDQFVIVSVGNCNHVKNHPALLRALTLLPSNLNWLYLHVGREPSHQPERALAAELGIGERVRFCGSQEDIRQYLWAADVYVMPSLREGLGIAAVEAVATGTPVVFTDIEGLREVAEDIEHAVLVATDAESIAQGIQRVVAMPSAARRALQLAGSERMRAKFSPEQGVRSIVAGLYEAAPRSLPLRRERTAH